LKQFLRYQISGTVFLIWLLVFYYGREASTVELLIFCIFSDLTAIKSVVGLFSAIPIGVIIHQSSVLFKNFVVAKCWSEFDDSPRERIYISLEKYPKRTSYVLERISNLNSFYYVRVDNGFVSPVIAWIIVSCSMDGEINNIWSMSAFFIGLSLVIYISRIKKEIRQYYLSIGCV
jgi:hypothetical protein